MSDEPCQHCENIRQTAEGFVQALILMQWQVKDLVHLCAYLHAKVRFKGLQINEEEEKDFLDFFNHMCDLEFKELHHANPLEPKTFDEFYDFRTQMKNGE